MHYNSLIICKMHRDRWCTAKENSRADSRWQEILKCIVDVVFFLAEGNLSFHGHSSKIGDPESRLLLGVSMLHNRVLALYLQKVLYSSSSLQNSINLRAANLQNFLGDIPHSKKF